MQPADSGSWFDNTPTTAEPGYPSYSPYPSAPPPPKRISLGDLLTVAGSGFIVLFSVTPFVSYPDAARQAVKQSGVEDFSGWYTAWSAQTFMAPLTLFVVVAGAILLALVGLRLWKERDLTVVGFQLTQLQVGVALFAFLVLAGYALSDKQAFFGLDTDQKGASAFAALFQPSFAWGGMFMLFGSLLAVAGVILTHLKLADNISLALPKVKLPNVNLPGKGKRANAAG